MLKTYSLLTKPGIIIGNLITTVGGFALASKGNINYSLFLAVLVGLGLIIASACVWNNYIDRDLDQKMERTKNRALVKGTISFFKAKVFAAALGILGSLVLFFFAPPITLYISLIGLFVYVVLYSLWKGSLKYATLIGSVAGAIPIVVGYVAVTQKLDLAAFVLFAMMVLWQMPHFFAIALYRVRDYEAAAIPVLPVLRGIHTTQVRMLLYIIAFLCSIPLLTVLGYTGYLYLTLMALVGGVWLFLSIRGFKSEQPQVWARKMFLFSLVVIMMQSFLISVNYN